MRTLAQKLSTGKWLLGLTVVVALLLGAGILLGGPWGTISLILGLGAAMLVTLGLIVSYKEEVTLARSARARLLRDLDILSDQLRAVNSALDLGVKELSAPQQETKHEGASSLRSLSAGSMYAPGAIAAAPVNSKQIGRAHV